VILESEAAEAVLGYMQKFEYSSRNHVLLELLWHTAVRTGSLRALDVEDNYPEEQYLEVLHRPDTETPLKNKSNGERLIALSDHLCSVLDDWISTKRKDVTDEYGRSPLLSKPCIYGDGCPHDRDLDECEARRSAHKHDCPSSRSPHAIRAVQLPIC
jgi:integrase